MNTTTPQFVQDRVIDAVELSRRYLPNRNPQTISKDLSRRPHTLPPRLALPGGQQALWLESAVIAWLQSHQIATPILAEAPRRRGRPTKRAQYTNNLAALNANK